MSDMKLVVTRNGVPVADQAAGVKAFLAACDSRPLGPAIGDYVLGTKYHDGDPGDPWAIGFYGGTSGDRHLITHEDGSHIARTYRRVGRITREIGSWLWENRELLARAPSKISLWGMYDWAFVSQATDMSNAAPPCGASKGELDKLRKWVLEALGYVGCEAHSPSLLRDGMDLLRGTPQEKEL